MDEELDNLARRYALTRRITLGERLGFGIHGIVFAAQDNARNGVGSSRPVCLTPTPRAKRSHFSAILDLGFCREIST
jgi:hypothetical protein